MYGTLLPHSEEHWLTTTSPIGRRPPRLIHSAEDEIIPFLTSQQTYAAMRLRGSPNLNLVSMKTGGHAPTEAIFMRRSLEWFEQLRD